MKTKLLRFNKLPKIQSSQNQSHESKPALVRQRKGAERQSFYQTSSFKKLQPYYNNLLLQLVEKLTKKPLRSDYPYQLQPRDRTVLIDLPQLQDDEELDDETLKQWVTNVFSYVFSSAFNAFSLDKMTYEQTKVFCSEGILKNIVILTKKFSLDHKQMRIINDHISQNIVPYMLKKYPMSASNDVNKAFDEKVNPIDNRQALQNNLLQKCDVVFTYREEGNYNDLIMKFLNWLIMEIDFVNPQTKKTPYSQFYQFTSKMFENVCDQAWMCRDKAAKMSEIKLSEEECLSDDGEDKQKYKQKVKEYTHYVIGRKISKNVQKYSHEQIQSGHLSIKNPSILRILTKWCDQLWQKFKKKNYFLDREQNIRVQEKGGNINTMFMWMKIFLNDLIQQQKSKIQDFMKELQINNFDQQSQLLIKQLQRDGFTHIEKYEKACGKFSYKTVNNLHSYIVLYLNRIIHGLLTVSKTLYQKKLSSKSRWSSPPDLLSFKVGDLMRCKCSSKEREIIKIYEYLAEVSQNQPKLLKVIRVKNRLKEGTNDILINVIYQEKYLCEIQLAVKSATSKFILCSNMFNHYIYELGRTLFGPITELCSVWISLDPRSAEYLYLIKNEKRYVSDEPMGCQKKGQNHEYIDLNRPFICSSCGKAYSHSNYLWMHQKCNKQQCGFMVCGICQIESQGYQKLKQNLLKNEENRVKNSCISIVNRKTQSQRFIPTYGLCVPIESQIIKVQKFKKIEYNKIVTLFGFKKDPKTQQQVVTKIEELIKKDSQSKFFSKYLVFEIPNSVGENLINIDIDRAKKQYIIPQKIKEIYLKEVEILSLIQENIDDESIRIIKGRQQDMQNIINMELADNRITNISFIANNFPKIQRIQLSRNQITQIKGIARLKNLKMINVRNNQLTELPDQICQLQSLQSLNIRFNKISAFPEGFGNLRFMNKIEADNNQIKELPLSFKQLTNLTSLYLSNNQLTAFPECIRSLAKIKELALANNKLNRVPQWIGELKELTLLDLSKTQADNFPQSICGLKQLKTLKIQTSYNAIPPGIDNLAEIKHLIFKMPNLKALPSQLFKLSNNLKTLELLDCKIQLPEWLSEMKKLQTFSLINNDIDVLPKQITEMVNLNFLAIQGQRISSLPQNFDRLSGLRAISLDNNEFKQIPLVLRQCHKIQAFSIKDNRIQFIQDDYFDKLTNIETLSLDGNLLKALPFSISKLSKLKVMTYDNNLLQSRPEWMQIAQNTIYQTVKSEQFIYKQRAMTADKPK